MPRSGFGTHNGTNDEVIRSYITKETEVTSYQLTSVQLLRRLLEIWDHEYKINNRYHAKGL